MRLGPVQEVKLSERHENAGFFKNLRPLSCARILVREEFPVVCDRKSYFQAAATKPQGCFSGALLIFLAL